MDNECTEVVNSAFTCILHAFNRHCLIYSSSVGCEKPNRRENGLPNPYTRRTNSVWQSLTHLTAKDIEHLNRLRVQREAFL